MQTPRVSIVIPAYDAPEFLAEAIETVVRQTFSDFELIVVDDGSPGDLSPAFASAAPLGDRFRVVRQDNAGPAAARNRGIGMSRGEWIAFLDHDDRWLPTKLERQISAVEGRPDIGMVYCQFSQFGETARDIGPVPASSPSGWLLPELLRNTLIRTMSVVMIRRDLLPGSDWFRTDMIVGDDATLLFHVAELAPIEFVPEVLAEKRLFGGNITADHVAVHANAAQVTQELADRLMPTATPTMRRLLRKRIGRHLIGAAEAARARGEARESRSFYRRAFAVQPTRTRVWTGWMASWFCGAGDTATP